MKSGEKIEIVTVPEELSGKRADLALSELLPGLTRSRIKKLIGEKNVRIDGEPVKPSRKLEAGEAVCVTIPAPVSLDAVPEDIPLTLIYEDDYIAVIDKPPGMAVHPGAGAGGGTLVNALLYRLGGLSGVGGKIRPGIVHRLDKNTSGVMVVAKNDEAHNSLVAQFKSREVEKTYLAIVAGEVKGETGSFSSRIGRHPTDRKKMSSKASSGRESLTHWKVVKRLRGATLVEARPRTGRTHQIRVHFSEGGYPLLADEVYGGKKPKSPALGKAALLIGRQALHAWKLGFTHPITGKRVEYASHMPRDMREALNFLGDSGENSL